MSVTPLRGEVWLVNLDSVKGHEQAGTRPALVISVNEFNRGLSGLVWVLPITSTKRNLPQRVKISPPEGGLDRESYVVVENLRSISTERCIRRFGKVSPHMLNLVMRVIDFLLHEQQ